MKSAQRALALLAVIGVSAAAVLGYGALQGFSAIAQTPPAATPAPGDAPATPAPNATPAPPPVADDKTPPAPPATPEQIAEALKVKPTDIGIGDPNAPVKWIEYASSGCPHCAEQDLVTLPKVKAAYIDTGKVYYVLRDFPLDGVSAGASILARCMPQDKFYAFMDKLFSSQHDWHSPDTKSPKDALFKLAADMGMTNDQAEACLKDQSKLDTLQTNFKEADQVLKVDATPTNYFNGEKVEGALPFEVVEKHIQAKLGSQ